MSDVDPLGESVDPAPRPRPEHAPSASVTLEPLAAHAEELWPAAQDGPESWRWLPFGPFADCAAFTGYLRFMAVSEADAGLLHAHQPRIRQSGDEVVHLLAAACEKSLSATTISKPSRPIA
jgi:hypothetical protein